MADRKITDLTALAAGSQATGDLVTIVDVSETAAADKNKKMTMENLFKGIPGNVGIGTASTDRPLHVESNGTDGTQVQIQGTLDSAGLKLVPSSGDHLEIQATTSSELIFYNRTDTTYLMSIDSSGSLGLGVTSLTAAGFNRVLRVKSTTGAAGVFTEAADASSWLGLYGGTSTSDSAALLYPSTGSLRIGSTTAVGTTGFSEKLRIDSNGRLLVGGTSSRLGGLLQVESAGSGNDRLHHFTHNTNTSESAVLRLVKSRGTAVGAVTAVQDDDNLGYLVFTGTDGTGNIDGAYISAEVNGTPATNNVPTDLLFWTNDGAASPEERMRLNKNGQLMLNTTTKGVADADTLTLASGSSTGITIRSSDSGNGNLFFSDATSGTGQYDGFIQYQQNNRILKFGTASSERMRILSGGGITFNGDTAVANALDDYEEGTWTPTFVNGGTGTYIQRTGKYTKIGRLVHISIHMQLNNVGTASGSIRISGLPFSSSNSPNNIYGHSSSVHGTGWSTARSSLNALLNPASSEITTLYYNMAGATGPAATHADIGTGNLLFNMTYTV